MRYLCATSMAAATAGLFFFAVALAPQSSAFVPSKKAIPLLIQRRLTTSRYMNKDDFASGEYEDDDDDVIDADSLGDWRAFRRSLAANSNSEQEQLTLPSKVVAPVKTSSVSRENEELLESQNKELADEYRKGVWAHETSVPEVGGLLVRLPLEAELHRNHKHSLTGRKLRKLLASRTGAGETSVWYSVAQSLIEDEMMKLASQAADDQGQINANELPDDDAELLQLYLDNQETWQEVCLVWKRDESSGQAAALVLNRPMALKLTENMAQLVLYGAGELMNHRNQRDIYGKEDSSDQPKSEFLVKFLLAFGQECAVYIGGPDEQDQPAELIHGIEDLPGAREISPGSKIYCGGLTAAVDGVLRGKYRPMDFRFFIGRHEYEESEMDLAVVLGKYQPVACARSLALKQCLSLPKPLWHEVLDMCGGHLKDISQMELLKRDDLRLQIVDDDEHEEDEDDDSGELDLRDLFDGDDGFK